MNRDQIKYVAMFTMLLNHIANVFLEPGTFLFEVMVDVGYFTAITMCYFLVEGYCYTRSKEKYGKRLLLFALISEIPFCLAFTEEGTISFVSMNMLFTLFLCFLILYAMEKTPFRNPADTLHLGPGICLRLQRLGLSCPYLHLLVRKLWPPGCTGENCCQPAPES